MTEGLIAGADGRLRCAWAGNDPLYHAYHDQEWGRPTSDDRYLFEKLCLEGFQSGLSWLTILRKRENFRRAFANFDAEALCRFGPDDVTRLLGDAGIVRHRGKIESTLNNAAGRSSCAPRPARSPPSSGSSPRPRRPATRSTGRRCGPWPRRRNRPR